MRVGRVRRAEHRRSNHVFRSENCSRSALSEWLCRAKSEAKKASLLRKASLPLTLCVVSRGITAAPCALGQSGWLPHRRRSAAARRFGASGMRLSWQAQTSPRGAYRMQLSFGVKIALVPALVSARSLKPAAALIYRPKRWRRRRGSGSTSSAASRSTRPTTRRISWIFSS